MTGIGGLKAFAKSPHHAWLGVLTLGVGLASASPVLGIPGAAAYGLGWVFLPDSNIFRKWLSKKQSARQGVEDSETKADFEKRRTEM